jgi:hypothetical protein
MNFEITNIDTELNHVSFNVLNNGDVILTDKRCDLTIDDEDAMNAELDRFSIIVIEDYNNPVEG